MKSVFQVFTLALLTFVTTSALAQSKFVEGKDYKKLETEIPLHKQNQPEVAEYFWFGCPHCYHIKDSVTDWKNNNKPKNVDFHYVPSTGGGWEFSARGMYIAEKLKLDEEKFHEGYFSEIHTKKNRGVAFKHEVLAKFMQDSFGVTKSDYDKANKSLQVKSKLKAAKNRNLLADITSVPVFIVNGKYLVSAETSGTEKRMFEIINSLLAKDSLKIPSKEKKHSEIEAPISEKVKEAKEAS